MSFSSIDTSLTLEALRSKPENQYLERKGRDTKPSKVANELIGMLNAGGGTLVVGIADNGSIEDLRSLDLSTLNRLRKLVYDLIEPPANIEIEEITLPGGELVFIYHVEQDHERLFRCKDNESVFLRVADSNKGPLSRDAVRILEYNKQIRSFENESCESFDPGDLDIAVCQQYLNVMKYEGSFEQLALKRSIAVRKGDRVFYKNAAVLLFAKDPTIYIPNASVRYVRIKGTELKPGNEFNVVKDQRFEVCIPAGIAQLETFVEASLRDYYFLNVDTGRFEKISEFPKEAWLEGIVNALCHRSYNLQGNCVYLKHFDDRLEISNSGPLPAQVTVANIQRERYARNPRIARVMAEMGYVRELNEGVPRIFSAMQHSLLAEPEYVDRENTVTLTLRNKVTENKQTIPEQTIKRVFQDWAKLNKTQHAMLAILFNEQESTIQEIVSSIGVTEQAIRYNLKKLEEMEIIERLSDRIRDPNARYRFKNF